MIMLLILSRCINALILLSLAVALVRALVIARSLSLFVLRNADALSLPAGSPPRMRYASWLDRALLSASAMRLVTAHRGGTFAWYEMLGRVQSAVAIVALSGTCFLNVALLVRALLRTS
jgi:hypothetical protein